jgi:hypothetical protein
MIDLVDVERCISLLTSFVGAVSVAGQFVPRLL